VVLAADQLVRDRDPHDVGHPTHPAQVERAELLHVADQADDRTVDAPAHERLTARRLDERDDGPDICFIGLGGHDDDHAVYLQK
jgi:hypothetical protein